MPPLRLLIADDHTIVRQGLRKILEGQPGWSVAAQASNGREAIDQFAAHEPHVAILDIGMPVLNGIEASQEIVRRAPAARVLMLSMHADRGYVARSIRAGARGYLLKDSADADLIRAVVAVAAGKTFLSPSISRVMIDDCGRNRGVEGVRDPYELLSSREREILQQIVEGRSGRQIAESLSISPATVETHRTRLMDKLDLHNVGELVLFAVRRGLVR